MGRPRAYRDSLLCDKCKLLFSKWVNDLSSSPAQERVAFRRSPDAYPLIQFGVRTAVVSLSDWSKHYWKQHFQEKTSQENGGVSIPWWQVPLGPTIGAPPASSQDLR